MRRSAHSPAARVRSRSTAARCWSPMAEAGTPTSSTLIVGASGRRLLSLANGSEVAVGVALDDDDAFNSTTPNGTPRSSPTASSPSARIPAAAAQIQHRRQQRPAGVRLGHRRRRRPSAAAEPRRYRRGDVGRARTISPCSRSSALSRSTATAVSCWVAPMPRSAPARSSSSGGVIAGAGTLSGLGGGNGTVQLASIDNGGVITAAAATCWSMATSPATGHFRSGSRATLTLQAACRLWPVPRLRPGFARCAERCGAFWGR